MNKFFNNFKRLIRFNFKDLLIKRKNDRKMLMQFFTNWPQQNNLLFL